MGMGSFLSVTYMALLNVCFCVVSASEDSGGFLPVPLDKERNIFFFFLLVLYLFKHLGGEARVGRDVFGAERVWRRRLSALGLGWGCFLSSL